jgi:hypothetical protein
MNKLDSEKITVKAMIELYCHKKHKTNKSLCSDCETLLNYCVKRIDICTFGVDKPVCSNCTIHCYNKENRDRIKEVMRFSGPRMLYSHPILTVKHLIHKYITSTKNNSNNE